MSKKIILCLNFILFFILASFVPSKVVFAATPTPGGLDFNSLMEAIPGFKFTTTNGKDNLGAIVSDLIPWAYGFAGILLLIMLIVSGFQMMTSAGDPKAAMAAKGRLTGALIGFLIIFCSYWIVQIVQAILGFNTGLF